MDFDTSSPDLPLEVSLKILKMFLLELNVKHECQCCGKHVLVGKYMAII